MTIGIVTYNITELGRFYDFDVAVVGTTHEARCLKAGGSQVVQEWGLALSELKRGAGLRTCAKSLGDGTISSDA